MKKQEILVIGCGGAGNRMVNEIRNTDQRYLDFYVNTNLSEMENLKNYDERKVFYIPNADGAGKNKAKAEKYIMQETAKFADIIVKFKEVKHVVFITGASGGTGGTAATMLARVVKKVLNVKVSIIAAFPTLTEGSIDFENTLQFWEELTRAMKDKDEQGNPITPLVDSVSFIDNNKSTNLDSINRKVAKAFNQIFNALGEKIDTSDIDHYFTERGYSIPLVLSESIDDLPTAMDKALKNSLYYAPRIDTATVVLADLNTDSHLEEDLIEMFPNVRFKKIQTKQNGDSIILLAGCTIPAEPIELVNESLKETNSAIGDRPIQEEINFKIHKKERVKEEKRASSNLNEKELDIFSDPSFWEFK